MPQNVLLSFCFFVCGDVISMFLMFISYRILKLLNQRKLESLKETWWNQNPEKKNCDDEGKNNDGISIKNIGLYHYYYY